MKMVANNATSITAFRISASLLADVDACCELLDATRSQLFRRAVGEFVRRNATKPKASIQAAE
jgi:predicted transcriptional regulator